MQMMPVVILVGDTCRVIMLGRGHFLIGDVPFLERKKKSKAVMESWIGTVDESNISFEE